MQEIWYFLIGLLPSIVCGFVLFYSQRAQRKRDEKAERRAAAREREAYVTLEVTLAGTQLSYATACAVKRGKPNGEMEEAMEQYKKAG